MKTPTEEQLRSTAEDGGFDFDAISRLAEAGDEGAQLKLDGLKWRAALVGKKPRGRPRLVDRFAVYEAALPFMREGKSEKFIIRELSKVFPNVSDHILEQNLRDGRDEIAFYACEFGTVEPPPPLTAPQEAARQREQHKRAMNEFEVLDEE